MSEFISGQLLVSPLFPQTLCIGSRLFIEGRAAQEWVFEESMLDEV